jgi:DNA modification methylase
MEHNWAVIDEWRQDQPLDKTPSYRWYREHGGVLGLEPFPEWYIAHLVEIFDLTKDLLKPNGSLWINLGDTYFARWSSIRENGRQGLSDQQRMRRRTPMGDYRQEKQLLLIPARFAIAMQGRKWILRNDVIWYKPNIPPRPEKDRLRLSHEHFFHFVKRPKEGRAKYYYDLNKAEADQNDVVLCNVAPGQDDHTATFPKKLIEPRILSSCPPGGLVVDPFCGSGRTLAVAIANDRRAWGCDLVTDYALSAKRNLNGVERYAQAKR